MRLSARTNRLHVQNLLPFRLYFISLDAQSTIKGEVSQSHEGKPPFWSGNLVGASPYAAAELLDPVPGLRLKEVGRVRPIGHGRPLRVAAPGDHPTRVPPALVTLLVI